jgi:hypothetical protein
MSATHNYAAVVREKNQAIVANRLAMGDFQGSPSYRAIYAKKGVRGVKRGVRGRGQNVRKMFMDVGKIGSFNVELVIPQAFFMVRTTDPDAQATILTVEGLQRAINKVGGKVEVNGVLTPDTVRAVRTVSGESWMSKSWLQIYGDFGEMIARGMKLAPTGLEAASPFKATGEFVTIGDSFTAVPTAVLAGGLALLYMAFR